MENNYAVIMAGGIGSRLWPVSRKKFPKQFHDLLGVGKTLLQMTFDRLYQVCPVENIYIVTNEIYKDLVKQQLPLLKDSQILTESIAKNTAPCIAYASHKIYTSNKHAKIVVCPSDHLITNEISFVKTTRDALKQVEKDVLLTFGITPSRPDTGYGYIEYQQNSQNESIYGVNRFTEKPDLHTAKEFVSKGNYLWNSGIFVWSAKTVIQALEKYQKDVNDIFKKISYGQEQEQLDVEKAFNQTPSISIDYAVMEKATNVMVMPVDFGWTDLGTWKSIFEIKEKDESNNVLHGDIITDNTSNSYIKISGDRLAVIHGLDNYIVIEDNKVLLICHKDQEQKVKHFLKEVEKESEDFI